MQFLLALLIVPVAVYLAKGQWIQPHLGVALFGALLLVIGMQAEHLLTWSTRRTATANSFSVSPPPQTGFWFFLLSTAYVFAGATVLVTQAVGFLR